jgi:hypothetical protein
MSDFKFKFEFDESELQAFKEIIVTLGEIDGSKAIMNSLSKGMALITRQGKSNLNSSNKTKTGNLKRSIRRKQVKKWVSVYGGFKRGPGGGNHAHLVDRGTTKRYTRKGKYRGSISKDNPNNGSLFWTKAVESKGPQAMEKTMKVIYDEMNKIINKHKK